MGRLPRGPSLGRPLRRTWRSEPLPETTTKLLRLHRLPTDVAAVVREVLGVGKRVERAVEELERLVPKV
jgi:hypothetical protein